MSKSIAIIETSAVSYEEIKRLCTEIIPEVRVVQIVDDSLIPEVNENVGPTKAVKRRLYNYYMMAQSLGVDLILNQCSSVGEVVDEIKPFIDIPIVKIDEAMARRAVSIGSKIGVITTVESTTGPSVRLIESMAKKIDKDIQIDLRLVAGAMMRLIEYGDVEGHNNMVKDVVVDAAKHNDVIVLAQGSMTVLLPLLEEIEKPVLSSPRLAIEYIKEILYR